MKKFIKYTLLIVLLVGAAGGGLAYWQGFTDNVNPDLKPGFALLIPRGSDFQYVLGQLEAQQVLKDVGSFERIAKIRKYDRLVKPGRYEIKPGTTNWKLVEKLRAGDQDQMKLRIGSHRTLDEVAGDIAGQVDIDSASLSDRLQDADFLQGYGVEPISVRNLLIPNTYFVYWTITTEELFRKLKDYHDDFWSGARKAKAEALGMTPHQVVTLASIVQAETYMVDERPIVAGLYLNRIRQGIPLQADPTLIFAAGDFSIKRVLNVHKEIDSPYNTYKHTGLPPGPINNPEISAIDAVLSPDDNDYIYMCAKADFSGHHNFAKTLAQHNQNAKEYQAALNKQKVFK